MTLCTVFVFLVASASVDAAETMFVGVSAVVRAANECVVSSGRVELDFGTLDPENPVDMERSSSIDLRCAGNAGAVVYMLSDDGGLNGAGDTQKRMIHLDAPGEYIPYRISFSPRAGVVESDARLRLDISGILRGSDYRDVYAGNYEDSVTLTITP